MRWLTLYARSRQIPMTVAAALITTFAVWSVTDSPNPRMAALSLVAAIAVLSTGLTGQDPHLDRTAAIRWLPRRFAHAVFIAATAAALLLAFTTDLAPASVILRDSAGLTGLAAMAAAAFGGSYAWTPPFAWFAVAAFIPPTDDTVTSVATWMFQPPDNPAATWTAAVLAVGGAAFYAVRR
jgi:hypothetical protein